MSGLPNHPPPPYASEADKVPYAQAPNGGSNNSQYFVLNNPILYDGGHYHMGASTLQQMIPFILRGAEFDSFERDPPPRCHPGTRQDIMRAVLSWRHKDNRTKRLLWLNGSAGVGKSAIIQTLTEAEAEATTGKLGATLFISRPNKRADPNRVLGTIAYQLAVKDSAYRGYLTECLSADPMLLGKTMSTQFKVLITRPFGELVLWQDTNAWSIYIDGVDECHGEEAQRRLIELISTFTTLYPEAPLVWILSSRPENHLQNLFAREDILPTYHEVTVPVNSDQACRDVERYLRIELTKIKDRHPDLIPPTILWPTESQFLEIARVSSGLFVFASTVVLYVGAPTIGESNPVTQLQHVLAIIRQAKIALDLKENPLAPLDLLYHQIMTSIPPATLRFTKQILGLSIQDVMGVRGLVVKANILGLNEHTIYAALARLHSVIDIPKPEDALSSDITILHASFTDYLGDEKRSGDHYIDITETNTTAWRCFFRILQQGSESQKYYALTLSWKHPQWKDRDASQIVKVARTNWPRMLMVTNNKFRMYSRFLRICTPLSEQIDVLGRLFFNKLDGYILTIVPDDLVNFLLWIRYCSSTEIRMRLFTSTIEGQLAHCSRITNRIVNDKLSYEIVWWPRESCVKWNLTGFWGRTPPHAWNGDLLYNAPILGTIDELMIKLRAEPTRNLKSVVLGGWFAIVEERQLAEDGSVRIYILRLSERISDV